MLVVIMTAHQSNFALVKHQTRHLAANKDFSVVDPRKTQPKTRKCGPIR